MQLEGTTIRIACNQAARDSFVNTLGGQPPTIPRAGSVRMPCAIFLDDPSVPDHLLTDLGNLDAAHCVIRAGDAAGTVLFEQVVPAARFNPGLTFAQWTAGTAAHFEFALTPTDTNLPAGPLHIAIGVTTTASDEIPLAYCSTARLRDYGLLNATTLSALSVYVASPVADNQENLLQLPLPRATSGEMQFALSRNAVCSLIVAMSCTPFQGAAADLLTVRRTTDGVSVMELRGAANATYVLQYCGDLRAPNWTDLATGTADNQGWLQMTDNTAGLAARRFYRARLLTVDAINVYVDSVGGNDASGGATVPSALRTLAAARNAALTYGAGAKVGLLGGSSWRESLDLSTLANATVQAVGTGPAPVIDGADVVTSWVQQGGTSFVYYANVAHDAPADTSRLTVYEDGTLLKRVADTATCDSTPGSFVDVKGSDGSPVKVYVHPTDSDSPASNGHRYEVTTRLYALAGGAGFTCKGIQSMRAIGNDGALALSTRTGVSVSQTLLLDGTKHNTVFGAGTVRDSIAAFDDLPTSYEPSNIAWTAYLPDPTGQSLLFERCGTLNIYGGDFLAHGNGSTQYASAILRQCWTVGTLYTNVPGAAGTRLAQGCYVRGASQAPSAGTWDRCMAYLPLAGSFGVGSGAIGFDGFVFQDSVLYVEPRYGSGNYLPVYQPSGTYSFSHGAFAGLDLYDYVLSDGAGGVGSTGVMTASHTVFFGGGRPAFVPTGMTYVADYNVYYSTVPGAQFFAKFHGTDYATLAAWQTATGQDAHSVYLAAADQTAGNAGAFWLGVKNAASGTDPSTVGPRVGDWRVNPNAKVYAANGTAYTGTFPDGTAITTAGPQAHWDWNARASAPGAPTAFPVVPATLADAQAYVLHPDAWRF